MADSRSKPTSPLRRSFDVYYRDTARAKRMDALNAAFVPNGGLAFDIGAHVGDRTASFRRLGARVVALEPQPQVFRALRLIHGRDPGVTLQSQAVGRSEGTLTLHLNTRNPTVSTLSTNFIAATADTQEWQGQVWDHELQVTVTTLDCLIAKHGKPDFIKIDVEGFELDVLEGLSQTVPALSFEITTIQRDVAMSCVRRLQALGPYSFNASIGEDHLFVSGTWLSADDMACLVTQLPDAANSGDVYARLL